MKVDVLRIDPDVQCQGTQMTSREFAKNLEDNHEHVVVTQSELEGEKSGVTTKEVGMVEEKPWKARISLCEINASVCLLSTSDPENSSERN